MDIFVKTEKNKIEIENLINKIENIEKQIKVIDNLSINKIKENFIKKTDDFFNKDRKLNIAIIGQVKAGKSSFLNTMIFDGKKVLPTAATPKTATLTKIEYSKKNYIEIEYYSSDEWKVIEENSKVDSNLNEFVVAREIIDMVNKNKIDVESYLDKKFEKIQFNSYENLMEGLNEYIGEDGKLTPLVKLVKIGIDNEELKEISVIDTPGLNDPIASRTDKTKQFIEMCDVVFFLSRASQFLDKSDVQLLTSQLPQKGVKKLVFICSRYDDGLADTIFDLDSLDEADIETKTKLKRAAKKIFDKIISDLKSRQCDENLINVIQECENPIFVSSMAYNMAQKSREEYNEEEENVYDNLNENDDIDNDILKKIGNIDKVKEIFQEVILNKDETLLKRLQGFIPDTLNEIKNYLNGVKQNAQKHIDLLANNDKEELIKQKKCIESQMNKIKADIENIFGEINIKLERNKGNALSELRNISKEYSSIDEKTGTETHVEKIRVSTSKWYNPFSWGTSRTEYYTYEEHYQYLDAADALENLRNFSMDSANKIEETFSETIEIRDLKRKILNVVLENFDTADENYDPQYFKLMAEKTMNNIEIPVIKIDVSNFINNISSKFSGEIRQSSDRADLKLLLADCISKMFDEISSQFSSELIKFKKDIEDIKNICADELLNNIIEEFNKVILEVENKEAEINKYNNTVQVISGALKEI